MGPHLDNETERLPSDGSREWWAGMGLNRRHQDFQILGWWDYRALSDAIGRVSGLLPTLCLSTGPDWAG
jgi:hypothetical protein